MSSRQSSPHPPVLAGFTKKKKKKLILCDDKLGSAFTVHTVPTKLAACQGQAVSQHDHNKHEPCVPLLGGTASSARVLGGTSILNSSTQGDQHPRELPQQPAAVCRQPEELVPGPKKGGMGMGTGLLTKNQKAATGQMKCPPTPGKRGSGGKKVKTGKK